MVICDVRVRDPLWTKSQVIQHSLAIQFADHSFFGKYCQGAAIGLFGASYMGKTTLLKEIREIRPNFIEETETNASFDLISRTLETNHEKWGVSVEDCHHLRWVLSGNLDKLFLLPALLSPYFGNFCIDRAPHASEYDKNQAKKTLQILHPFFFSNFQNSPPISSMHLLLKRVLEKSYAGKNTIFESKERIPKEPFTKPIYKVFLYCSLSEYINRIDQASLQAFKASMKILEVKIGIDPLLKYASFLRAKEYDDEPNSVLERITPRFISQCFSKYYKNALRTLHLYAPEQIEAFKQTKSAQKKELLKAFGFDRITSWTKEVELVPCDPYDQIFYTEFNVHNIATFTLNNVIKCTQIPDFKVVRRCSIKH